MSGKGSISDPWVVSLQHHTLSKPPRIVLANSLSSIIPHTAVFFPGVASPPLPFVAAFSASSVFLTHVLRISRHMLCRDQTGVSTSHMQSRGLPSHLLISRRNIQVQTPHHAV